MIIIIDSQWLTAKRWSNLETIANNQLATLRRTGGDKSTAGGKRDRSAVAGGGGPRERSAGGSRDRSTRGGGGGRASRRVRFLEQGSGGSLVNKKVTDNNNLHNIALHLQLFCYNWLNWQLKDLYAKSAFMEYNTEIFLNSGRK